jgi:TM2 domain-containing membrane protein YozV
MEISNKSRLAAALLAFFLGAFGIHNFYLGRINRGIAQLILTLLVITSFISYIWAIVEAVLITVGRYHDSDGAVVARWE